MKKNELLEQIDIKIRVGRSCVGIAYIIGTRAWVSTFKTYVGPGTINIHSGKNDHVFIIDEPKKLIERYEDPKILNEDGLNIIRLGSKDMLTQTFELIRQYCKDTHQTPTLESRPWYQFARLVRNSFSHDFTLSFKTRSGKMLSDQKLQFLDRIIELKTSMNGQELDLDVLPMKYVFELVEMMKQCVIRELA